MNNQEKKKYIIISIIIIGISLFLIMPLIQIFLGISKSANGWGALIKLACLFLALFIAGITCIIVFILLGLYFKNDSKEQKSPNKNINSEEQTNSNKSFSQIFFETLIVAIIPIVIAFIIIKLIIYGEFPSIHILITSLPLLLLITFIPSLIISSIIYFIKERYQNK